MLQICRFSLLTIKVYLNFLILYKKCIFVKKYPVSEKTAKIIKIRYFCCFIGVNMSTKPKIWMQKMWVNLILCFHLAWKRFTSKKLAFKRILIFCRHKSSFSAFRNFSILTKTSSKRLILGWTSCIWYQTTQKA